MGKLWAPTVTDRPPRRPARLAQLTVSEASATDRRLGELLNALEAMGYPYAPRYRGVLADGCELLEQARSEVRDHPRPSAHVQAAVMLRDLHDRTSGTTLAASSECLTHGAPGPTNTVFDDGDPVLFINWQNAAPGEALADVAYLAWTWSVTNRREADIPLQARRMRQVRDAYGLHPSVDLTAAVLAVQDLVLEANLRSLRTAMPRDASWHEVRIDWVLAQRAFFAENHSAFARALA